MKEQDKIIGSLEYEIDELKEQIKAITEDRDRLHEALDNLIYNINQDISESEKEL